MDTFTESEIAGFGVGALLLAASLAAPKIDFFFAKYQRRSLKLCEKCGGVTKLPCKKCRGRGKEQALVALPWESKAAPSCDACRGRGQLPCPSCSRA
ncbi:unnamed protein product [Calypogeia fissa]